MSDKSYGTWEVTTEANEDGSRVKSLGIYSGFVDEIALALADKCFYALEFTPTEFNLKPKRAAVNVRVCLPKSDVVGDEAIDMFKDRPVTISPSTQYGCFTIKAGKTPSESERIAAEIARNKVLAKLSEEDRKVLGFS